jgi:hypothetical protein
MAQLEYGDLYKFVASAGIALVAGAFAVPWLFLREPFDLTIDASKLKTLTPVARDAVMHRQEIVAGILAWLPWASAVLAILGSVLIICGLAMWYRRQRVRDRGEEAATKKAEQELQHMTVQEVEAKALQELESVEEESQQPQVVAPVQVPVSAVDAYLDAERALFARMSECLGPDVQIQTNRMVGNVEYDAIVRLGSGERVIVDVKYIRKGFNSGFLAEAVNGLTARTALYASRFSAPSRAVLVIILASPNSIFVEKIENLKVRLRADRPQLGRVGIYCITKDEIPALTCQRVRQMLEA